MSEPLPEDDIREPEKMPRTVDEWLPQVYKELRRLAQRRVSRESSELTLQATALVHEAYLRLNGGKFQNRRHFFAAAAEAMRRILIERARRVSRIKHGGERKRVEFEQTDLLIRQDPEEIVALDAALEKLEVHDPMMSTTVKLRYFAGFSIREAAEALELSPRTVDRLWSAAKAWLYRELSGRGDGTPA